MGATALFVLHQATSTFISTVEIMMFNGVLALSVVVVCAVHLLGVVAGDENDDTVPQVWDGGWSCDRLASTVDSIKWDICKFVLEYDLGRLLRDALFYCPFDKRVISDLETLAEDALVCSIV